MKRHRLQLLGLTWVLLLSLLITPIAVASADDGIAIGEDEITAAVEQFNKPAHKLGDLLRLDLRDKLTDVQVTVGQDKSTKVTGKLDGSFFLLHFPRDWNHQLVLYAHGYDDPLPGKDINLPGINDYTKAVLDNAFNKGFAYGYSSYTKLGYAVESGIKSTHALNTLVSFLGLRRTYLLGESMGGNVVMGLVEKYPNQYDGALPYCGVVSGWYEEMRYLTDFRLVYDFFTLQLDPKIAPLGLKLSLTGAGDVANTNSLPNRDEIIKSVGTLFALAQQNPEIYNVVKWISAITGVNPDPISYITPLFANSIGLADYLTTTGGIGYGNIGKVYNYNGVMDPDTTLAALNAYVQRVEASPSAKTYLQNWYTTTGKFNARVLSVHNTIDPLVPYEHELILKGRVAAQKNSSRLVQQVVDPKVINPTDLANSGPAHCYFNSSQMLYAWGELQDWVEHGKQPKDGADITKK